MLFQSVLLAKNVTSAYLYSKHAAIPIDIIYKVIYIFLTCTTLSFPQ